MVEKYEKVLKELERSENKRYLSAIQHEGDWVVINGHRMLNLSSNDYLGLGSDLSLRQSFLNTLTAENLLMTSSSSRLLTGNFRVYEELESLLCSLYNKEGALIVGSGYHANSGILPALCDDHTLVVADKLIHASLIDGIRLANVGKYVRYRHNDMNHLEHILQTHANNYARVFICTESVFSMDGDTAPLETLVELKKKYQNCLLYLDEAHGVGVRGKNGLGYAEEHNCIDEIDIFVGTLGKALASAGAFILCSRTLREYLVNKMRTLIFTTALPPLNIAWTKFIIERLPLFQNRRENVDTVSRLFREGLAAKGYENPSNSHIVPLFCGESAAAVAQCKEYQRQGYYALPVRPPTVPEGTSRIRFSLNANVSVATIKELLSIIPDNKL